MISSEDGNKRAPNLDRSYSVNPLRKLTGLYYSVYSGKRKFIQTLADGRKVTFEAEATSPLKSDIGGRGKIEYVAVEGARKIRVDTMLIPLSELYRKDKLRVCYFVKSPSPQLTFNTCGFRSEKDYYRHGILPRNYQTIDLGNALGNELDKTIP